MRGYVAHICEDMLHVSSVNMYTNYMIPPTPNLIDKRTQTKEMQRGFSASTTKITFENNSIAQHLEHKFPSLGNLL
jgi:hypothetical protein